jgi:4-amino-4-deoxy-L-arabinose transferase-like glycosyltransferase
VTEPACDKAAPAPPERSEAGTRDPLGRDRRPGGPRFPGDGGPAPDAARRPLRLPAALQRDVAALGLLVLWGIFVYYGHLGTALRGDEGMYAAIARGVVRTGDWLGLEYEGRPYVNKPPLHFWKMAVSMLIWGQNDFAVRFPSATFGLATTILVYYAGKGMFHRGLGLLAALITTTTLSLVWHAHQARLDVELGFFMNLAGYAFFLAYRNGGRRLAYLLLAFLSMAAGTMLKGPVSLILPGLSALAFLAISRRTGIVREVPSLAAGLGVFLLVTVPYFWTLGETFNQHFFLRENLPRIVEGSRPLFFYWYMIVADYLPWSVFLPSVGLYLWRSRSRALGEAELFLRVWFIGFFLLLNLPAGKAERFLVFLVPPFALLLARCWEHLLNPPGTLDEWEDRLLRWMVAALAIVTLAGLLVGPRLAQARFFIPPAAWPLPLVVAIALACAIALYAACRLRVTAVFSTVLALAVAVTAGLVSFFYPALARYDSAIPVSLQVRAVVGDSPLVIYHPGGTFREDILYYLDRPSPVPHLRALEDLVSALRSEQRVFALLGRAEYGELEARRDVPVMRLADFPYRRRASLLISNQGP